MGKHMKEHMKENMEKKMKENNIHISQNSVAS